MTTATFPHSAAERVIASASAEDAAADDITTRWSVPEGLMARAEVVTRQPGIAAGLPAVGAVFAQVDKQVEIAEVVTEGSRLRPGDVLMRLCGPARSLITAERTLLNIMQRLCGIATLTRRYVEAVAGLPVRVLDTRKTAPGLRALDKYAVTDIANANSAGCLAAHLLVTGRSANVEVDQGHMLDCPSTVHATATRTPYGIATSVGGSARVTRTVRLNLGP